MTQPCVPQKKEKKSKNRWKKKKKKKKNQTRHFRTIRLWVVGAVKRERVYERGLVVLASGKHNDVGSGSLRGQSSVVRIFAVGGLLKEAHDIPSNAAEIAALIGRNNTEQALAGLLGQVGLLEDTLRRVDVRKIESGSGVARIKNGCQTDSCLERSYHNPVHLIVRYVTDLAEIDRIDNFVVTIRFVAV